MTIIIKNKHTLLFDDFIFKCCVGKNGFTKNKIEKVQNQIKFSWQKSHKPNLTGTEKAYHPKKSKNEIKKYRSWKE